MIKRTTLLLLIALLFTACTERTHMLSIKDIKKSVFFSEPTKETPKIVKKETKKCKVETAKVKKIKKSSVSQKIIVKKDTVKSTKPFEEKKAILIPKIKKETVKESSIFDMSDETKKKLSGFFIYIIAIMILM